MDKNLKQGVEIEKEHRNLYIELSNRLLKQGIKMPMTETEFFTWIAQAHIAENKDYYPQLLKYVEKEHDNLIDKTVRVKNIDTPGKVHFKNDEGYYVKFPGGFDAYFQANQLTPIPQQTFKTGGSPTPNIKQPNIQTTTMIYQTKFNELKSAIEATPGFTKHEQPAELKSLEDWSASYNYYDCHIIIHFGNGTNKLPDNELKINITKNYGSNGLGSHREFSYSINSKTNGEIVADITIACEQCIKESDEKVNQRFNTLSENFKNTLTQYPKPDKKIRHALGSLISELWLVVSYKPELYPALAELILSLPSGFKANLNPYNEYDGSTEVTEWLKLINKNVLDFLPVKEFSLPKYKPFDTTPDDKTFMAIHGTFAATDEEGTRPQLLGTNFGPHGVVTTDAMQLLFTKYNTTGVKNGNYCHTKKCFDNEDAVEQAKYPNWAAIVPHGSSIKWHLNAHALINALKNIIGLDLLPNFAKYICLTSGGLDNTIAFDAKALLSTIESLVKLGHTDLEMGWSAPNRAALIYPKGNGGKIQPSTTDAKFETDFALLMPRVLNDTTAGDPYFNVETNCVTFGKDDAPYCFDAAVTESKKIQAREQALATELANSKAQIEALKQKDAERDAEIARKEAEAEAKRQALAAAADAKRKQEIDNKHLGNIEALARKIKTKKQAKEAISKARTFTVQQINDTIAGNLIVLETMADGPAKQALHDYTEGLRVMVDTDNVYADGGGVFRPSGLGLSYDAQMAYMYDKITKAELEEFKKLERTAPSVFIGYQNMTKKQAKDWDRLEELKEKIKSSYEYAQGGGVKVQTLADFDIRIVQDGKEDVYEPFDDYESAKKRFDELVTELDYEADGDYAYSTTNNDSWIEIVKNFSRGGTVGKIKASTKDIQSIEHLVDFSVRGNSHQLPYDGEVERMLEDHRMFLNDKEFFDKYGDKIGAHPDADEFEEESGNMEEFRITDQYYITFKDDSEIQLDFTPDGDFQTIYSPDVDEHLPESRPKTMAVKHYDQFAKQGWDMDITALEEFVNTGKFEKGGAPNQRFIFGVEYKANPASRVFKKASLTMNGADTTEMNEAITKNAEALKKQEGWHEIKITKTPLFKDGGKVTDDLFLLKSVGTYINKQTGDTYAAFKDGSYDDNNPVNVLDIEVDEWFDSLSPADKKVVNIAKKNASQFKTGGPILRNGKESYEVGDEGMFEGGEVVVKKVTKTTYVFSYVDDNGTPFARKFTVPKKQFEKQFAYFPKK